MYQGLNPVNSGTIHYVATPAVNGVKCLGNIRSNNVSPTINLSVKFLDKFLLNTGIMLPLVYRLINTLSVEN